MGCYKCRAQKKNKVSIHNVFSLPCLASAKPSAEKGRVLDDSSLRLHAWVLYTMAFFLPCLASARPSAEKGRVLNDSSLRLPAWDYHWPGPPEETQAPCTVPWRRYLHFTGFLRNTKELNRKGAETTQVCLHLQTTCRPRGRLKGLLNLSRGSKLEASCPRNHLEECEQGGS